MRRVCISVHVVALFVCARACFMHRSASTCVSWLGRLFLFWPDCLAPRGSWIEPQSGSSRQAAQAGRSGWRAASVSDGERRNTGDRMTHSSCLFQMRERTTFIAVIPVWGGRRGGELGHFIAVRWDLHVRTLLGGKMCRCVRKRVHNMYPHCLSPGRWRGFFFFFPWCWRAVAS
ncbi:LANO_0F08878g1_1 [Lachancea nothofagi CBS 11611]|uniref:LANO_0F08878g1_1 n=1 Tax=Lachancea nothofagi CBS 11611 TaxID=1266666 RepID=A0A1G4K9L6_9SACH|nr:LANO_0F08878g1_1 [Lachancea nothofagi CBS 11611]